MRCSQRYSKNCNKFLDAIAYALLYPWVTSCSLFLACYISDILEKLYPQKKLLQYIILGPIFAALVILLLPMGMLGALIWIGLCTFAEKEPYSYCVVEERKGQQKFPVEFLGNSDSTEGPIFTFATANVLLGPDFLNKLNHNTSGYFRCREISQRIISHNGKYFRNMSHTTEVGGRRNFIFSEFPSVDFLCLQEVWERVHASVLMKNLSKEYGYFIYDVGEYNFKSNLYLLGSGLMFASKKPILEAEFKPFSFKTNHAKFTSLGVLCIKAQYHAVIAR